MKKRKNKHLIPPSEIAPPSWDPSKTIRDWDPENIRFDDEPTVCALCSNIDCICTIQICPCGQQAPKCKWPSDACPCPICDELMKNCECNITIKDE
jgi:hypothetical protein